MSAAEPTSQAVLPLRVDTKATILAHAAELLAASPSGDISTRAVCEAAGVGQPMLYRLFGDKDGLLAAVADRAWEEYLAVKRAATPSPDPLHDLRDGWDAHTEFALSHPAEYRLVFASTLSTRPQAASEALALLTGILERVARAGQLALDPGDAARVIMSANSGFALGAILRPEHYRAPGLSELAREAAIRSVTVAPAEQLEDDSAPAALFRPESVAAHTIRASLDDTTRFSPAEAALLTEWLGRF